MMNYVLMVVGLVAGIGLPMYMYAQLMDRASGQGMYELALLGMFLSAPGFALFIYGAYRQSRRRQ